MPAPASDAQLAADTLGAGNVQVSPLNMALVAGQDVEPAEGSDGSDGRGRIARKVAPDRVISTVDPDARHTRKSPEARRDGYRAHVVAEPHDTPARMLRVAPDGPGVDCTDHALPFHLSARVTWSSSTSPRAERIKGRSSECPPRARP